LLLDPDNAITAIEQALHYARKARSGHFINLTLAGLAEALIAAGELEQAARTLQQQPEDLTFHTVSARVVWRSRTALALAQGDPQRALWINDALIDTDVNYSELAGAPMLAAQRGEALYALGRLDDARTALEAALRGLEARGIRANVWRLHCALRGAHLDAGDLDKAGEALDGARAALNALAMSISDESKRDAFLARAERETARDGTSTDVSIAAPGATDRG
jgi:ATP/maltotriose-dependent transcriptional regulator MalT